MEKSELKIVFMGTPNISATTLEALILDGYNVIGVVAQPDRPVGRKAILEKVPTKVVAEKYGIPVYQPEKIRNDYSFLLQLKPDIIITLAYGQIVPQGVLDIPPLKCLNLHGSLLPKYRGASPIQTSLINNEKVTGVTLMEMIKQMDAGKMYAKEEVVIEESDNSTSLFLKVGEAAKRLILRELPRYINGELPGEEQNEEEVTFCHIIKPEEEKINLELSKENILGWIRGLSDEPGAYLLDGNEKFKIFKAKIISDEIKGEVGQIIQCDKFGLVLQVKDGLLGLLEVQKQGKKRMDYKSFVNGNQNFIHTILK